MVYKTLQELDKMKEDLSIILKKEEYANSIRMLERLRDYIRYPDKPSNKEEKFVYLISPKRFIPRVIITGMGIGIITFFLTNLGLLDEIVSIIATLLITILLEIVYAFLREPYFYSNKYVNQRKYEISKIMIDINIHINSIKRLKYKIPIMKKYIIIMEDIVMKLNSIENLINSMDSRAPYPLRDPSEIDIEVLNPIENLFWNISRDISSNNKEELKREMILLEPIKDTINKLIEEDNKLSLKKSKNKESQGCLL